MKDNQCSFSSVCGLNRRQFLGGCVSCTAGLTGMSVLGMSALGAKTAAAKAAAGECEKAKVRLVFTHAPPEEATWPNIGYDYEGRKRELTKKLRQACPEIEFSPATVKSPEAAGKILKADKEIDGYLVYILGLRWDGTPQTIADSGRPTIFVDDLYGGSGEFLTAYAAAKRKGLKVTRRLFDAL